MSRFREEIRAAIDEGARAMRRHPPASHHRSLAHDAQELLQRYLADPDSVTAAEVRSMELQIEAAGRWRIEHYGRDDLADERTRRLWLLANIRKNLFPQIADAESPLGGQVPRRGTYVSSLPGGQSRSVEATQRRELVGENIRRARTAANLTQTQLADKLGVRRTRVADWERGARGVGDRHLEAIVEVTGAPSFGWFLDEHPAP